MLQNESVVNYLFDSTLNSGHIDTQLDIQGLNNSASGHTDEKKDAIDICA